MPFGLLALLCSRILPTHCLRLTGRKEAAAVAAAVHTKNAELTPSKTNAATFERVVAAGDEAWRPGDT